MDYKILYIEDLNADTIIDDLAAFSIEAVQFKPQNFNDPFLEMVKEEYDAVLLDFKLQEGVEGVIFDAPTLAQSVRTRNIEDRNYKPLFLITNQLNISSYFKDFSSHDLFDYVNEKTEFRNNIQNRSLKIKSFILAYRSIKKSGFDLKVIFGATEEQMNLIDYRIIEALSKESHKDNVHKISFFIYQRVIKSANFLVGEDILSARLGIAKDSPSWTKLLDQLEDYRYKGVFSDSHNRWYWEQIAEWWVAKSEGKINLRRTKATKRAELVSSFTGIAELIPVKKLEYAMSECFWTICMHYLKPIDPIDGLELNEKELLPWQETEYISMVAGLETVPKSKFLNPSDRARMIEFNESLN